MIARADSVDIAVIEADLDKELLDLASKLDLKNDSTSEDSKESEDLVQLHEALIQDDAERNKDGYDESGSINPHSVLSNLPAYDQFEASSNLLLKQYFIRGEVQLREAADTYNQEQHEEQHFSSSARVKSNIKISNKWDDDIKLVPPQIKRNGRNRIDCRENCMPWVSTECCEEGNKTQSTILDKLREAVELEAREEHQKKKGKRLESRRKREIKASRERVYNFQVNSAANQIQSQVRMYQIRGRIAREVRNRNCIAKLLNALDSAKGETYFEMWRKRTYMLKAADRLVRWARICLEMKYRQKINHCHKVIRLQVIVERYHNKCSLGRWRDHVRGLKKRLRSITLIQSHYRKKVAQRKVRRRQSAKRFCATIEIQRVVRGCLARRYCSDLQESTLKVKGKASAIIQRAYRGARIRSRLIRAVHNKYDHRDIELDELLDNNHDDELEELLGGVDQFLDDINVFDDVEDSSVSVWKPKIPEMSVTIDQSLQNKIITCEHAGPHQQLMNEWKITDKRVLLVSLVKFLKLSPPPQLHKSFAQFLTTNLFRSP